MFGRGPRHNRIEASTDGIGLGSGRPPFGVSGKGAISPRPIANNAVGIKIVRGSASAPKTRTWRHLTSRRFDGWRCGQARERAVGRLQRHVRFVRLRKRQRTVRTLDPVRPSSVMGLPVLKASCRASRAEFCRSGRSSPRTARRVAPRSPLLLRRAAQNRHAVLGRRQAITVNGSMLRCRRAGRRNSLTQWANRCTTNDSPPRILDRLVPFARSPMGR
jgi:hypothetical protein